LLYTRYFWSSCGFTSLAGLVSYHQKPWMSVYLHLWHMNEVTKLVGVNKTVKEVDNTQKVKIKTKLNIIFSNNKYW